MEDLLGLYEKLLSEKEPLVCVDEKPMVLHADARPPRPMRPGRVARPDSEYKRQGTANVFCGVQPKAGKHFTKATPNRSSPQFADYLVEVAAGYPRFGENIGGSQWDRFTVHYTPKPGSWLNQTEIKITLFSRPVSGPKKNPVTSRIAARSAGMEPKHELRPCHYQLAVYAHKGAQEVRL
jgi:DDE superfamily endonuclease